MTNLEAKQALARKLDIDYSDIANNSLFSDADLQDYIQAGVNKAWDYKPWSFKEGDKTTIVTSDDYLDYPTDFEDESVERLTIAAKEYDKKLFADYQKYFEDNPTATNRFWSEHRRFIFTNKNACTIGDEIVLLGTLRAPTLSGSSDVLPFSPDTDNQENSGNRAIILLAYAEALSSDKKKNPTQAAIEEKKGYAMLDIVWTPMAARKAAQQSQDRPFF